MSAPAELLILVSALGQADTSYLPPLNDNPPNFHILPAARQTAEWCSGTKKRPPRAKYLGQTQPNNASCQAWAGGGAQKYLKVRFLKCAHVTYCWSTTYLIFVIFVTQARFLEPKFYTQKCVN